MLHPGGRNPIAEIIVILVIPSRRKPYHENHCDNHHNHMEAIKTRQMEDLSMKII